MSGILLIPAENSGCAIQDHIYDISKSYSRMDFAQALRGGHSIRAVSYPADMVVGAAAISVTQSHPFGSLYLMAVRRAVDIPTPKDVSVVHKAGYRMGADILIQAVFDAGLARNGDLIDAAYIRIQVLVVHDKDEHESAISHGCDIISINNRNLDTLNVTRTILAE